MSVVINLSDLVRIGKEDTWKYFTSIFNVMDAAKYYRFITRVVLEEKTKENAAVFKGEKEMNPKERYCFLQGDLKEIGEINVSRHFLNSLFVKNFFQYSRNSFDYASHIINELFVNPENKIDKVDFEKISRNEKYINNSDIAKWVDSVKKSTNYVFINDYCNQIKHNYDMGVRQSLDTASLDIFCQIPSFEKDGRLYPTVNGMDKMEDIHKYVSETLVAFMDIIREYLDSIK